MKYFRILENDGHNAPTWWKFRDLDHAARELALRLNFWDGTLEDDLRTRYVPRTPDQIREMLEGDGEFEDANGTVWTAYGERDLPEIDCTLDGRT